MAGIITTGNHPKALWPGVKAWFGRQYNEHKPEYVDLFDMDTSSKNYEELVELTGFGLAPEKDQTQSVTYDSETQGITQRIVHVAYALGYMVSREELDDNLYEIVSKRRARALAFSIRQTKENVGANIYNRAFSSTYLFADGKELLATDHPSLSGDQQNELTTAADMSEASLEDLVILIMGATNSKGLKISLLPRSLIVPRNLWFDANRILKATLQPDVMSNNPNVLKMTNTFPEGIKMNHYLTDTDAFFIRTNCPEGLMCLQRTAVEFTQDNDFDTMSAKAKGYERYSFGFGDWRTLYGSPGA